MISEFVSVWSQLPLFIKIIIIVVLLACIVFAWIFTCLITRTTSLDLFGWWDK